MSNWQTVRLGDITEWKSGGTPSKLKPEYWNGDIPWISASSMYGKFLETSEERVTQLGVDNGTRIAEPDDILLLVRGSMLMQRIPMGIAMRCVAFNQDVKSIRAKPYIDKKFLFYNLLAREPELLSMVEFTGIGAGKLDTLQLQNLPVELPPLPQQRAIARVLGDLDDKIECNRRINATLESLARALFKAWFVDFEPFNGTLPEDWQALPLDEAAKFLNGLALQKYPATGSEYLPVIKIAELKKGVTAGTDKATPNIPVDYIVDDGDFLFSWSGSLEAVIWAGGRGALNQHLFKVTSETFPQWFIYDWVHDYLTHFRGIAADKATTMGHIQRKHLAVPILVPSPKDMAKIDRMMQPLHEKMLANQKENRTLAELRDSLLPRLLSGELTVGDAEQTLSV